jgi:RNA polymerase sigma factor (sigma-70 family)
MWIVEAQAKRAKRPEIFDDLVQVGLSGGLEDQGLLRAIRTYDATKGANFWTHATVWIWGAIRREVATRESDTLAGRRKRKRLRARAAGRLHIALGREPTDDELDGAVGVEPRALSNHLGKACTEHSKAASDPGMSDGMGESSMVRALLGRQAIELLAVLPEIERKAVKLHLLDGKPLADVGTVLGVSREWARHHVKKGCARLRAMMRERVAA